MNPDLWIVLEPGRIFLWPLQPKRRWTWRVISPVGYTHVSGQAWGRDRALAEAHHAVRPPAAAAARP